MAHLRNSILDIDPGDFLVTIPCIVLGGRRIRNIPQAKCRLIGGSRTKGRGKGTKSESQNTERDKIHVIHNTLIE